MLERDIEFGIHADGPNRHRLWIDGKDISNLITRAHLVVDAADVPMLILTVPVRQETIADGKARVVLDSEQEDLLIGLGWTPPND